MRRVTIVCLRPMNPRDDDQHTIFGDGSAGEKAQPFFHLLRQRGGRDVNAQLDRRFFVPDVLAGRTHRVDETFLDIAIVEADAIGPRNMEAP